MDSSIRAIKKKRTKIARVLIDAGANLNHKDDEGTYIVHYAVFSGSYEALELLIEANVKLKSKDQFGLTPLVYALKQKNSNMIKKLKSAGGKY